MEAVFGTIGAIAALGTMIGGFITCNSKRREIPNGINVCCAILS